MNLILETDIILSLPSGRRVPTGGVQRRTTAQVTLLIESVPPWSYGGTERVVSWIAEEFVRQGHEVTLFASGNAGTSARLVPCGRRVLRLDAEVAAA